MSLVLEKNICYHCHDVLQKKVYVYDNKSFCCNGCQLVYQILNENNLCNYYDDNATVGIRKKSDEDYSYLDETIVQSKYVIKHDSNHHQISVSLPQIHCISCIWLLEKIYKIDSGIIGARANVVTKQLEVRYDPNKTSLQKIATLLHTLGYAPSFNLSGDKATSSDKNLLLKIGIAGFAFGNIMLFSFPEYLGLHDPHLKKWFGYVCFLLIQPALLYSAKDYFVQFYYAIIHKMYSISVPLVLGMGAMYLISMGSVFQGNGPGYLDSLSGLIFFLLIGKWYQHHVYHFLSFDNAYSSFFPMSILRKTNYAYKSTSIDNIQIGDELLVKHNQILPCDGHLKSDSSTIDYSFITGESEAVNVKRDDLLLSGGRVIGKAVEIICHKPVNQGYLSSLWNNAKYDKKEIKEAVLDETISKYFTIALISIALCGFLYWMPTSLEKATYVLASILIIACPCAIAISRPFLYGNITKKLTHFGIYQKNANVIEVANKINTIVFDKTGTITEHHHAEISYEGKELREDTKQNIATLAMQSSHTLSNLVTSFIGMPAECGNVLQFKEIPSMGIQGIVNGSLIKLGNIEFANGKAVTNSSGIHINIDGEYVGVFKTQNQYRANLQNVVKNLAAKGYNLSLISGDTEAEKMRLKQVFPLNTPLLFKQSPTDKIQHIAQLQNHSKVAMIGDGINDAGALTQSDLGIVITEEHNHFIPSCEIIIASNNFGLIDKYFTLSHNVKKAVNGAYLLALIYNVVGISLALKGNLSPVVAAILMPLSSVTIVIYSTISATLLLKKLR
jgi:P-type Cu+ transporter